MRKRPELMPFTLGVLVMAYLTAEVPQDKLSYLIPYGLLTLAALRRKTFPYGASALFSGSLIEWFLTRNYLALVGIGIAILVMPIKVEKQPVKLWERVANTVAAGTVAYVSLVGPNNELKAAGILAVLAMLSGNRGVSSAGILAGSAVLTVIPLAYLSDMDPTLFLGASVTLMVYSIHHLRKLLR